MEKLIEFQKHTSGDLVELFNKRPYQGQDPQKAKVIFLSSDANYSPKISEHSFFNYCVTTYIDEVAKG